MQVASQKEAISKVRGLFKLNSQDTLINIPDRMILSELQSTTIKYLRQATDKRKLWNSGNIFSVIPCVPLKQVPLAECYGYETNKTIARSIIPLPKIAEGTNFGMLIQGIYSIDTISRRFIESTPDRYVNSLKLGLRTNQIHFWIQEKYLYLGDEDIEKVKISAYFEEDISDTLLGYPTYCNQETLAGCCPVSTETTFINDMSACCPKNPYSVEFSCPGYLVDDVIAAVSNKLLSTYKRSVDDKTTDGKDDTK